MKLLADTRKASQKKVTKCQRYLQKSTVRLYLTRSALDYSAVTYNTEDITKYLLYHQQQAGNTWQVAVVPSRSVEKF